MLIEFWQYNFPPFLTIQPNLETRKVQLEAWTSLILAWCENSSTFKLDVSCALREQPFQNSTISRGLDQDSLVTVLEHMKDKGKLEWCDKGKSRCFVLWHSPGEWAKIIYDWAVDNAHVNTVCTFYEIVAADESKGLLFHKMDLDLLRRCLKVLEKDGKAVVINPNDDGGVKFL